MIGRESYPDYAMKTPRQTAPASLATAGIILGSITLAQAGDPGPIAAYEPAPVSSCDACNDPGWYASLTALYLDSYRNSSSGGYDYDGDWDFGARGGLGFERPDGLFFEVSGFWYEGDFDLEDSSDAYDGELEMWYVDFLVGDNLHCGESCLDFAFGIRYADVEATEELSGGFASYNYSEEFDGIGPVLQLRGSRPLTDRIGIYAQFTQAILFGDSDVKEEGSFNSTSPPGEGGNGFSSKSSSDTIASITELEGGIQYNFSAGMLSDAYLRLGLEGQFWVLDSHDYGLFGGLLELGLNF
jgi:hypothetical protein